MSRREIPLQLATCFPIPLFKIGITLASMDTEARRIAYAQLLRESNGESEGRRAFAEGQSRWIVIEPYDTLEGGGFLMNDDGRVFDKDCVREDRFYATSCYNKPASDAERDWTKITYEEAHARFAENGKLLPYRYAMLLKKQCDAIP